MQGLFVIITFCCSLEIQTYQSTCWLFFNFPLLLCLLLKGEFEEEKNKTCRKATNPHSGEVLGDLNSSPHFAPLCQVRKKNPKKPNTLLLDPPLPSPQLGGEKSYNEWDTHTHTKDSWTFCVIIMSPTQGLFESLLKKPRQPLLYHGSRINNYYIHMYIYIHIYPKDYNVPSRLSP